MSLKRRPRSRRAIFGGAAIGVAATATAIKATLSGPLGVVAAPELEQFGRDLTQKGQAVIATAKPVLDETEARLQQVVQPLSQATSQPTAAGPARPAGSARSTSAEPDFPNRVGRLYSRGLVRKLLSEAAARHQVDPKLVLALSYWESGWDQSKVSETGAIGIMQVEPSTAQEAGPSLLGRNVDIDDPYDNADVGVAVFREDLDNFKTPAMALAAYYQGASSLRQYGMLPDTQQYVQGILDLATRMTP